MTLPGRTTWVTIFDPIRIPTVLEIYAAAQPLSRIPSQIVPLVTFPWEDSDFFSKLSSAELALPTDSSTGVSSASRITRCVLSVELRSRCLRQWFKEIVLSDVTRGDTRGPENGYPGGAGP